MELGHSFDVSPQLLDLLRLDAWRHLSAWPRRGQGYRPLRAPFPGYADEWSRAHTTLDR